MTKADKLREKLRATRNRMTRAEAIAIVGNPGGLSNMLKTGELRIETIEDTPWVILDPDYSKQRKTNKSLPVKRKKTKRAGGKKKHGKKAGRIDPRPFKKLAKKFAEASQVVSITTLALNNLIASANNLAATVRREVEGVETNPNLIAAIENQERAAEIARAA